MSYFEDVYLKRMNKDGTTIQERAKTRKEHEFDEPFLKKTKYQGLIYQIDDSTANIVCSLQPNKWNEDQMLSNILVSTKANKLNTGDILHIYQKVKDNEQDKQWLIVYVDDDITHGYQGYKAICLDETMNYTDEYGQTLELVPVKFVSATATFVQDKFSSYGSVSYREPKADRKMITKDFDFLKKGIYFDYKNRGWEIVGFDNVSIDGVAYVSISEKLVTEPEPNTSENILVGEDENFFLNNR